MFTIRTRPLSWALSLLLAGMAGALAQPQTGLVKQLQAGGYVIVMRHASSPQTPPMPAEADPGNSAHERQLDATGRATATAMGEALRRLKLPIGEVWTSPTYRARETARLAQLPDPRPVPELGDQGRSMQAAGGEQGAWLKARVAQSPRPGTNTFLVTHYPNIRAAFGDVATGLKDGESLVFRPIPGGAPELIAHITIQEWPMLAGP